MADLTFSQPERRNFLVPALLALLVLAAAFAINYYLVPHRNAELSVTHVAILPTHTVYASNTKLVGVRDQAQDDLYVLATVRIKDDLKLPIFIKDLTGTLTSPDDSEIASSAAQKNDIPNLYVTFPKLKPLASEPLLRETEIAPGQTAEGMVLLHFPVPQETWDQRKSATVTIDTYHQGPITIPIPK